MVIVDSKCIIAYNCLFMSSPSKPYKDDPFQRETRMILLTGLLICGCTIFFLLQKVYFECEERSFQSAYGLEYARLKSLEKEAHYLVSSNPICQFHHHDHLDSAAIKCLTDRIDADSILPMYKLLTYKGYKISSAWWLSQRFLNDDLILRMKRSILDQSHQAKLVRIAHSKLVAFQLYEERHKLLLIGVVKLGLLLWVILIFPIRWGWYLWKSKMHPLDQFDQFIAEVLSR
jgi:hypothetical protein